jgi:hypothetical protein
VFFGRILQKLCHRLQDLARKRLVRYRARQNHRPDERAESQNGSRSRCMLVFAWMQSGNQKLGDLAADGSLSAAVEHVYPIEQFKEAFKQSLKSNRSGKILFQFGATDMAGISKA